MYRNNVKEEKPQPASSVEYTYSTENSYNPSPYYDGQPITLAHSDTLGTVHSQTPVTTEQFYDNSTYNYGSSYYNDQEHSQYYDYSQQQQQPYYDQNLAQYDPGTYDSSYGYYYDQTYAQNQAYDSSHYTADPALYHRYGEEFGTTNVKTESDINSANLKTNSSSAPFVQSDPNDPVAFFDSLCNNPTEITGGNQHFEEAKSTHTADQSLGASQNEFRYFDHYLPSNETSNYYNYLTEDSQFDDKTHLSEVPDERNEHSNVSTKSSEKPSVETAANEQNVTALSFQSFNDPLLVSVNSAEFVSANKESPQTIGTHNPFKEQNHPASFSESLDPAPPNEDESFSLSQNFLIKPDIRSNDPSDSISFVQSDDHAALQNGKLLSIRQKSSEKMGSESVENDTVSSFQSPNQGSIYDIESVSESQTSSEKVKLETALNEQNEIAPFSQSFDDELSHGIEFVSNNRESQEKQRVLKEPTQSESTETDLDGCNKSISYGGSSIGEMGTEVISPSHEIIQHASEDIVSNFYPESDSNYQIHQDVELLDKIKNLSIDNDQNIYETNYNGMSTFSDNALIQESSFEQLDAQSLPSKFDNFSVVSSAIKADMPSLSNMESNENITKAFHLGEHQDIFGVALSGNLENTEVKSLSPINILETADLIKEKEGIDLQKNAEFYNLEETQKEIGIFEGGDQDLFEEASQTNPYYSDYSYYNGQEWQQQVYGDYSNAYSSIYEQKDIGEANTQKIETEWRSQHPDHDIKPSSQSHQPILKSETNLLSSFVGSSDFHPPVIFCSYPNCRGENKITAKFCCECGRPLSNSSVVDTPTVNVAEGSFNPLVPPTTSYIHPQDSFSAESFNYPIAAMIPNMQSPYSIPPFDQGNTNGIYYDGQNYQEPINVYGNDAVNDPLQRCKGCPIIAFGFGGQILTMFPRRVQRFTSAEQHMPITKFAPGVLMIRTLKDIGKNIPLVKNESFPGPLLMDNNKGGIRAKRKDVLKYIETQSKEAQIKVNASIGSEVEKQNYEASAILWNLLKIIMENDGCLVGNKKVEGSVCDVLITSAVDGPEDSNVGFTVPADTGLESHQEITESSPQPLTTYTVAPESLNKMQKLLLKGDRVAAVRLAMVENLWAHALIIASCVNKDLWKEVVNGFVRQELSVPPGEIERSNGRESLRVLYSLLSGQGQNAINEFLPQTSLLNRGPPLISPTSSFPLVANAGQFATQSNSNYNSNPVSPIYASPTFNNVSIESLSKWRETVAMVLANRAPGDSQLITTLGDTLKEHGWILAAHACYLLSPQTSIHSGIDAPNSRFSLIGSDYTRTPNIGHFRDFSSLHSTEIYEFALTLKKNNEGGLPFLQPYKLIYAWWLVDCGYIHEAKRYCESIANIVKVYTKGSPYFHGCFLEKLKELTHRLLEHGDGNQSNSESSSWLFAKKMSKPTLDSLWGSLEGKFNKFVAGDTVEEQEKTSGLHKQDIVGPFSHFSAITQPTTAGVPTRSASAAEFRPPIDMLVDTRRSATPNGMPQSPNISEGQVSMTPVPEGDSPFFNSSLDDRSNYFGFFGRDSGEYQREQQQLAVTNGSSNGYNWQTQQQSNGDGYHTSSDSGYGRNSFESDATRQHPQQPPYNIYQPSTDSASGYNNSSAWWNNSFVPTEENSTSEPTEQIQGQVDDYESAQFISPMGSGVPIPTASSSISRNDDNHKSNWQDADDLGLGNNSFSAKRQAKDTTKATENNTQQNVARSPDKEEQKAPSNSENKATQKKGGGWFGGWFTKKESSGGNGKTANLGEENSFAYDPVLKKWVNKKSGSETISNTLPPPPPPSAPSRAKTESPTRTASIIPPSKQNSLPLPPAGNPPQASMNEGPYPSFVGKGGYRSTSSASTRKHRPKYVDIMNQPPAS
ncbi:hypothetical protein G9A89_011800 [Geosiphon pyriformis]|nr:hypothetical protein G9A89_011800 [Geosiphon pyriformis]